MTDKAEMVAKVARAIKERCDRSPTGYPGDEALARAAIEALREPTPAMILAGLETTDMLGAEDIDGEALAAAFRSMLRVALTPDSPKR